MLYRRAVAQPETASSLPVGHSLFEVLFFLYTSCFLNIFTIYSRAMTLYLIVCYTYFCLFYCFP
jgi:hypothetical protein